MKLLFGIWTITVALAVSAVAAYYSIIGLTAIFAAAVIPVIIMGVALEVAKITTAVWLHTYWNSAAPLIKWYLTTATIILMVITSMGIFGFLSKAHIEQNANSGSMVAQIERVDQEINRSNKIIIRANTAIDSVALGVDDADTAIQARITTQERLIADTTSRLETDITTQNQLVSSIGGADLRAQQTLIRTQRRELSDAIQSNDVRLLQQLVGADVDGVQGAGTNRAVTLYTTNLDQRQAELTTAIQQQADDPQVEISREEITRLQQTANAEIGRAQDAINAFRTQLISVTTADNTDVIAQQELIINSANDEISQLLNRKFDLQGQLRILEVEVGPVKYIAELVYGESNPDVLESAVRWVILLLVVVFDPLALVLVIAGLSMLHRTKPDDTPDDTLPVVIDTTPEIVHNDGIPEQATEQPISAPQLPKTAPMPTKPAATGIQINRTLNDN